MPAPNVDPALAALATDAAAMRDLYDRIDEAVSVLDAELRERFRIPVAVLRVGLDELVPEALAAAAGVDL